MLTLPSSPTYIEAAPDEHGGVAMSTADSSPGNHSMKYKWLIRIVWCVRKMNDPAIQTRF
jgi:hypothetical protein